MIIGTTKVQGFEMNITGSLPMPAADLSGKSNSTEYADKGRKAKALNVSLKIPFTHSHYLRQLLTLAEATKDGDRLVYDVVDRTAAAFGIKQVRFAERFDATEDTLLKAWNVTFSLKEYLSSAERVEKRRRSGTSAPDSSNLKDVVNKIRDGLK